MEIGKIIGEKNTTVITGGVGKILDINSETDVWQTGGVSSTQIGNNVSVRDTTRIHSRIINQCRVKWQDGGQSILPIDSDKLSVFKGQHIAAFLVDDLGSTICNLNTGERYYVEQTPVNKFKCIKRGFKLKKKLISFILYFVIFLIADANINLPSFWQLLVSLGVVFVVWWIKKVITVGQTTKKLNMKLEQVFSHFVDEYHKGSVSNNTFNPLVINYLPDKKQDEATEL